MHRFGLLSKIKSLLFAEKFSHWVYDSQTEQDYEWLEDNWNEFWDGYGELLNNISEIVEPTSERDALDRWRDMDICKTYYFWLKERHESKSDLVADILYLLWMKPKEA